MSTVSNFKTYFEGIATKLKEIGHSPTEKHFYRLDMQEILTNLNGIVSPALVLEDYETHNAGANEDSLVSIKKIGLQVLEKLEDSFDTDKKELIYNHTEILCNKIEARMLLDRRNRVAPIEGFQITGCKFYRIGPLFDGWYGCFIEFDVIRPKTPTLELSDWTDLEEPEDVEPENPEE
jgi:hypothetical protein